MKNYKQYLLRQNSTAWIEGIGSMHGLTRHFLDCLVMADAGFWNLLCYENNEKLLWSTPWNINDNCWGHGGGVNINENKSIFDLIIYPNPTTGELHIQSSKFKVQNVEIFDIFAKNYHHII